MSKPTAKQRPATHRKASASELAFAACRSIRFAVLNAERYGGEFSLNDILAANRLANEALSGEGPTYEELKAEVKKLRGTLAATRANFTRAKAKGGRS